jgi:hypothetical protein
MSAERWGKLRIEALRALRLLTDLLGDADAEPEGVLRAYLDTKARLAEAFQALALEQMSDPTEGFQSAIEGIDQQLAASYNGLVPDKYLRVKGYGGVHQQLFAYLSRRAGKSVSAPELRVITGDAVHTERRVRELRDLGFEVIASHSGGADAYRLVSTTPDFNKGALQIARLNIKSDRTLSNPERDALLESIGVTDS